MAGPTDYLRQALTLVLDRALSVNQGVVENHVDRARQNKPGTTPKEVVSLLERQYLATVTTLGLASGATAAIPGPWSPAAVALNVAEAGAFLEASTLFILAVAEAHGMRVEEVERRRTLVIAILLGDSGSTFVKGAAGRTGRHWARWIVEGIPMSTINQINRVLGPRFVTKYGTKQGILILGRHVPLFIGAAIGGGGNAFFGRLIVGATRRAFGPAPVSFPSVGEG